MQTKDALSGFCSQNFVMANGFFRRKETSLEETRPQIQSFCKQTHQKSLRQQPQHLTRIYFVNISSIWSVIPLSWKLPPIAPICGAKPSFCLVRPWLFDCTDLTAAGDNQKTNGFVCLQQFGLPELLITSLPLKKAWSSIGAPVVLRATGPLV